MNSKSILFLVVIVITGTTARCQQMKLDSSCRKWFVGSTLALLGNFAKSNNPEFAQINLGHRITKNDAISVELKTWKYQWPLGIPLGPSFEAPGENFPGHIREYGVAFVYQRFLWNGLYSAIHVMNARQYFVNTEGVQVGTGFQIFNTYRLGYQFVFFKNRFFIEPSLAITHRPFHTNMPDGFRVVDDRWPKYLIGEPGLHFGYNF